MYILGINGWISDVHDASACLFKKRKFLGAVEEERFTRQKHALDTLPWNCIHFLLKQENISPEEIDTVIFGWDVKFIFKTRFKRELTDEELLRMVFKGFPSSNLKNIKIVILNHHLSHAAGAYYSSPFNESNVFVIDGSGEREAISIYKIQNSRWTKIREFPIKNSFGTMYEALTEYVGFGTFSEGKVMGLTAYGKPKYCIPDPLKISTKLNDDNVFHQYQISKDNWKSLFRKITGLEPVGKLMNYDYKICKRLYKKVPQGYIDLAASVQASLQNSASQLVQDIINETGIKNICFSGGTSLNVLMNQSVSQLKSVENLFIQPAASDSGVSVGAVLYYLNNIKEDTVRLKDNQIFSGPSWSDEDIFKIMNEFKIRGRRFSSVHEVNQQIADLLDKQNVLAVFRGKMEFGPRALGNRSIIASPKNIDMRNRLNKLKNRESWRPFAPTILDTEASHILFGKNINNPFMLMNAAIKENWHTKIPAVVHADGTTRGQIISIDFNPYYYDLLQSFSDISNIPVLINTSFNVGSEPIVCSPVDAIRTFFSSDIDYLLLGNYLIRK